MVYTSLLNEISSGPLLIRETAIRDVEMLVNQSPQAIDPDRKLSYAIHRQHENMISSDAIESDNPFDSYEENSVVIIPIVGLMFKYDHIDWAQCRWVLGMDTVARLITQADQSDKIAATVLLFNTPGGSTQSILNLENALRSRTKPCYAFIDGICASAGIYIASFCDKIYSNHNMCFVGNIGACAKLLDNSKALENNGYKVIPIYPPESKWKNRAVREALDGKPDLFISEELSPFAILFQNIIKANRPKLDLEVEGILEGRDFYANDAVQHGLIDGIATLDQTIEKVLAQADEQQKLYSQFKH